MPSGFGLIAKLAEPSVRVMHADGVEAKTVHTLEKTGAVAHEPDDELALCLHAGVHAGMLHVRGLAFGLKDEVDLRMRFRARIDLAGTSGELKAFTVLSHRERGKKGQQEQREAVEGFHGWERISVRLARMVSLMESVGRSFASRPNGSSISSAMTSMEAKA